MKQQNAHLSLLFRYRWRKCQNSELNDFWEWDMTNWESACGRGHFTSHTLSCVNSFFSELNFHLTSPFFLVEEHNLHLSRENSVLSEFFHSSQVLAFLQSMSFFFFFFPPFPGLSLYIIIIMIINNDNTGRIHRATVVEEGEASTEMFLIPTGNS